VREVQELPYVKLVNYMADDKYKSLFSKKYTKIQKNLLDLLNEPFVPTI